jgi:hypothetical protein
VRLATPLLYAVPVVAYHVHRLATFAKPSSGFTVPLPCFFPLCLIGRVEIPRGSHKRGSEMGQYQTEIYYPTEVSYLKSVLLWLQEYWTGPAIQVRPLKPVRQESRYNSPRRTYAALNRRGEIIDLPAFLPPRNSSQYRQRRPLTVERWQRW